MHVCTYVPVQSMYLCISNASITYEYTERGDESFALQLINYIIHKLSQLLLHILDYNSDFWEVWRTESRKYCLAFLVVSSLYMLLLNKVFLWEEGHTPHILICGAGFPFFPVCTSVSLGQHISALLQKMFGFQTYLRGGELKGATVAQPHLPGKRDLASCRWWLEGGRGYIPTQKVQHQGIK